MALGNQKGFLAIKTSEESLGVAILNGLIDSESHVISLVRSATLKLSFVDEAFLRTNNSALP